MRCRVTAGQVSTDSRVGIDGIHFTGQHTIKQAVLVMQY